jgi:hypothetical protein
MESTWEKRDLPVLEATVQYFEEHRLKSMPQAYDLAPIVGIDEEDLGMALLALNGEYLSCQMLGGGLKNILVKEVHPSARRAVGQWPTPESLAERILSAMSQAADTEPDPDRRTKLKQTAAFLGSSGKDLLVNVLAAVVVKSSGID